MYFSRASRSSSPGGLDADGESGSVSGGACGVGGTKTEAGAGAGAGSGESGAAAGTAVDELDLIGSVNSGTAAQGGTTGYYDNIQVTSSPAPGALALLGVAGLAGARRRRA